MALGAQSSVRHLDMGSTLVSYTEGPKQSGVLRIRSQVAALPAVLSEDISLRSPNLFSFFCVFSVKYDRVNDQETLFADLNLGQRNLQQRSGQ